MTGDKTYDEVDQEENQNTLFLHNCWQMDMLFPIKLLPRVLNLTRKMVFHLDSMNLLLDWIRNMSTRKILIVKSTNNCRKLKLVMKSGIDQKLRKYFEDAAKLPLGLKIHEYYKSFAKDVTDVHQEAVRLANIKKRELEEKKQAESGSTTTETKDTSIPQVQ